MNLNSFAELIDLNDWHDVPDRLISREGHQVDTSGDTWHLPIPILKSASIDFSKIVNEGIRWATKRFIQDRVELTSSQSAYGIFYLLWRKLLHLQNDFSIFNGVDKNEVSERYSSKHSLQRLSIKWVI